MIRLLPRLSREYHLSPKDVQLLTVEEFEIYVQDMNRRDREARAKQREHQGQKRPLGKAQRTRR